MRIALVTDTYPPQVNGVARTLDRLVRHLVHAGHEVALVSPAQDRAPAVPPTLHLPIPGVPLPLYPELLFTRIPGKAKVEALEAFDPQVVHCATESVLGWWGRGWAQRTLRPLVTSFHTDFAAYAAGYGLRFMAPLAWELLRRFHAPAIRTLVPSHPTLTLLRKRGFHGRMQRWSRGVDGERFTPVHRDPATRWELAPGADVILLFVGRLAPEKRLPLLLEAFAQVRRRASVRVTLVLVGGGPMEATLQGNGNGGEPPSGVRLAGYLEGEALGRAYASADIFAFPSDTETFGNVVLEAMASGLPVVAVNRGGVQDSVRHEETGFLATAGDPQALASYLLRLVEDAGLRTRMGREGRLEALGRSWPRILDGVVAAYAEALSHTRGRRGAEPSIGEASAQEEAA